MEGCGMTDGLMRNLRIFDHKLQNVTGLGV